MALEVAGSKPVTRPISSRILGENSVHRMLSKMIVCLYRNEEADDGTRAWRNW